MSDDMRTPRDTGTPADPVFRRRLEDELLARHERLYGGRRERRATPIPFRRPLAFAAAAILLATAALAAVPVHVTVGLGRLVTIDMPPGVGAPGQDALLLHLLDARSGTEEVSVSVNRDSTGADHVLLLLFGRGPDAASLRSDLVRRFPVLEAGAWRTQGLEADVRTSLARRLGRRYLAIELDRRVLDAGRRAVLEQLAARGKSGEFTVSERDGHHEIEVRITDAP